MSEEWIMHDGNGCPIPAGTPCNTEHADGRVLSSICSGSLWSGWVWSACDAAGRPGYKVIRYSIRKPRGLTILENLIADIPAPVREGADA